MTRKKTGPVEGAGEEISKHAAVSTPPAKKRQQESKAPAKPTPSWRDVLAATTPAAVLAEHTEAIRALRSRIVSDVAEIGRRLVDVKRLVGHGNWLPWLDREFGWSADTAERFIRVHEFVDGLSDSASMRNLVLTLPVSSVYLLTQRTTPTEARDEIIERAKTGTPVSVADVKQTIETAKGRKQPAKKAKAVNVDHKSAAPPELPKAVTNATKRPSRKERRKIMADRISRFAYKLIQLDIELARELHRILWDDGNTHRLMCDLEAGIEIEEQGALDDGNGVDPEASADKRREEFAKLDSAPAKEAKTDHKTVTLDEERNPKRFQQLGLPIDDGLDIPPALRRAPTAKNENLS